MKLFVWYNETNFKYAIIYTEFELLIHYRYLNIFIDTFNSRGT